MRWRIALLVTAFTLAVVPLPKADHLEETLYASHACDNGNWYAVSSDAQSVTVACYLPDPDDAPKDDPDQSSN